MPAASNVPRVAPSVSQVPSMGLGFAASSLKGEAATQKKQPATVNNRHQAVMVVVARGILRQMVCGCGRVVGGVNSSCSNVFRFVVNL